MNIRRIGSSEHLLIVVDKIENIVGKEENDGYQHFLLFSQCFHKALSLESLQAGLCSKKLISSIYSVKTMQFKTSFLIAVVSQSTLTHSHTMTPFDASGKQVF